MSNTPAVLLLQVRTNFNLAGIGPVWVDPKSDFIFAGSEGAVYRVNDWAIKLYHEPLKMLSAGRFDKINDLSTLSHPNMVDLKGLVYGSTGNPIGVFMPFVEGSVLVQAFTNTFWRQQGFTTTDAIAVSDGMHDLYHYVHQNRALVVDGNEYNWILDRSAKSPSRGYVPMAIDVEAWQYRNWPATVLMESIKDFHSNGFSEASDWYAWAVITFQLFTGIHPYKGKCQGFAANDIKARALAGVSVLNNKVRVPRAVRDFSDIPNHLLAWYLEVFERQERSAPPLPSATTILPTLRIRSKFAPTIAQQGSIKVTSLYNTGNFGRPIFSHDGLVITNQNVLVDLASMQSIAQSVDPGSKAVRFGNDFLLASPKGDLGHEITLLSRGSKQSLGIVPNAFAIMVSDHGFWVLDQNGISPLKVVQLGNLKVVQLGQTWSMTASSSQAYTGVAVHYPLGSCYLALPHAANSLGMIRVKELDSYQVLTACAAGQIVVVRAADLTGKIWVFTFSFDKSVRSYQFYRELEDSFESPRTILAKGLVVDIPEDGTLRIKVPSTGEEKLTLDNRVLTSWQLGSWHNRVLAIHNHGVDHVTLT